MIRLEPLHVCLGELGHILSGRVHPNFHEVAPSLSLLGLKMDTLVHKIYTIVRFNLILSKVNKRKTRINTVVGSESSECKACQEIVQ